jgi:hypothetical protein
VALIEKLGIEIMEVLCIKVVVQAMSNQPMVQQSSYSAMLNIPEPVPPQEPVPTIQELVNSNSQPCLGILSYSGVAQKRNS